MRREEERGPERSVIDAKINPTSASPSLPRSTIINHLSDYDGSRRNILHPTFLPPSSYIAGATNFWSKQALFARNCTSQKVIFVSWRKARRARRYRSDKINYNNLTLHGFVYTHARPTLSVLGGSSLRLRFREWWWNVGVKFFSLFLLLLFLKRNTRTKFLNNVKAWRLGGKSSSELKKRLDWPTFLSIIQRVSGKN